MKTQSNTKTSNSQLSLQASGKELFWKFGIKKTTVEDITKHAELSKMTFYRIYKNKFELLYVILEQFIKDKQQTLFDLMDSSISFSDKIRKMIEMKSDNISQLGPELLVDIMHSKNTNILELLEKYQLESYQQFIAFLEKEEAKGNIREGISAQEIMYSINKINEMVKDPEYLQLFPDIQTAIVRATDMFFYGIINPSK